MDSSHVPLDPPVIQTTVRILNNFTVTVTNVVLGTSADILIRLYENENFAGSATFTISGEQYAAWGNDDQYIVNLATEYIRANYPF